MLVTLLFVVKKENKCNLVKREKKLVPFTELWAYGKYHFRVSLRHSWVMLPLILLFNVSESGIVHQLCRILQSTGPWGIQSVPSGNYGPGCVSGNFVFQEISCSAMVQWFILEGSENGLFGIMATVENDTWFCRNRFARQAGKELQDVWGLFFTNLEDVVQGIDLRTSDC